MNRFPTCAAMLLALAILPTPGQAADCQATVESNDAMQFSTRALAIPADCRQFTVTLKHTGKLPATAMGHNFVVGRDADIPAIVADGMKAGAASNFVTPGDPRVVAASAVIGGGQSTTVTIPVGQLVAGERYTFVCTFPGHAPIMRGTLKLSP